MSGEPSLRDLMSDLWRARLWLLIGGFFGALGAFLFVGLAVPHYKADMLVAPATRSGAPDVSALFPDTASFAVERVMSSLGLGESSDFSRFEAILREPSVARLLLEDEKIVAGLQETERFWLAEKMPPLSAVALSEWLHERLVISPVNASGLRRVGFEHPDPAFAAYFLAQLYEVADSLIREQMQDKTKNRVGWPHEAIAQTDHPEHRRVLTRLLMDQEQIRMVLAANEPFSAVIAEPPSVGDKPYWPQKKLIYPSFIFAGLLLSYAAFSLRKPQES